MMKKWFRNLAAAIALSFIAFVATGCAKAPQVLVKTQQVVIMPSEDLYNCPVIKNFPKSSGLKDSQVAKLIVDLQRNNITCKNSLEAIKKFLEGAQAAAVEAKA